MRRRCRRPHVPAGVPRGRHRSPPGAGRRRRRTPPRTRDPGQLSVQRKKETRGRRSRHGRGQASHARPATAWGRSGALEGEPEPKTRPRSSRRPGAGRRRRAAPGIRPRPVRSRTRNVPCQSPQNTNVQPAPCQSPQSRNTMTRSRQVCAAPCLVPPSGMYR